MTQLEAPVSAGLGILMGPNMRIRRLWGVAAATSALLVAGAAANADDCANVSRAPAPCGWTCTSGPVVVGNWVWLPSIGVPQYAWGFATPGSLPSQGLGLPGANGNYLDQAGGFSWLLENSLCVNGNTARAAANSTNGIQSGCGK